MFIREGAFIRINMVYFCTCMYIFHSKVKQEDIKSSIMATKVRIIDLNVDFNGFDDRPSHICAHLGTCSIFYIKYEEISTKKI